MTHTTPFVATILDRQCLVPSEASRKTFHVALDLKGSGIEYRVGDSVGIYAGNNEDEVQEFLKRIPGEEKEVADRKGNKELWGTYLRKKANLATINRKLVEFVAAKSKDPLLNELLDNPDKDALKSYLSSYHVIDFLEEFGAFKLPAEEMAPLLMPLMPRFYSVASSQKVTPHEVHLLIGDVNYTMRGKERHGVASYQLCHVLPTGVANVPLFHQPAHAFALTENTEAPIIMIGPGTGVAPYRGFMQERMLASASSRNWLFFGEWHESEHFFYQKEWEKLVETGCLKLTTAFSRDQQHKIYVQHRMEEEAKELFQWILDGAYIYVCGDASKMAKDVEDVLLEIFRTEGKMGEEEARLYLKDLRAKKRYQRDVY